VSIKSTMNRIINGRVWIKEQSEEARNAALARAETKRNRKNELGIKNALKTNSTMYQTKEDREC
jgi:hypothetical protein